LEGRIRYTRTSRNAVICWLVGDNAVAVDIVGIVFLTALSGAIIRRAWNIVVVPYQIAGEFVVRPVPSATDEVKDVAVLDARWTARIRILVEFYGRD
jgi:hypothetical protein